MDGKNLVRPSGDGRGLGRLWGGVPGQDPVTEDDRDHRQDDLDHPEEDRQREGPGPDHPNAGEDRGRSPDHRREDHGRREGDPGHPCTGVKVEADLQETRKSKMILHFMNSLVFRKRWTQYPFVTARIIVFCFLWVFFSQLSPWCCWRILVLEIITNILSLLVKQKYEGKWTWAKASRTDGKCKMAPGTEREKCEKIQGTRWERRRHVEENAARERWGSFLEVMIVFVFLNKLSA